VPSQVLVLVDSATSHYTLTEQFFRLRLLRVPPHAPDKHHPVVRAVVTGASGAAKLATATVGTVR
jgi:hypothetical protein